jgi:hypothetical protein
VANNSVTGTFVAPPGDALKRAVIQLFVAARHDDRRERRAAEVRLRRAVRELLAAPVGDERKHARGGLPPMVLFRAERLITAVIVLGDDFAALITQLQLSSKAATHPVRDDRLELWRSFLPDAVTGLQNIQTRKRQSFAQKRGVSSQPVRIVATDHDRDGILIDARCGASAASVTVDYMIVDHADRLHVRVDHR